MATMYGKLVPVSVAANILVTIESLMGLTGFAMMTGLVVREDLPGRRRRCSSATTWS